jgi:hypothetical protein
MDLYLHSPVCLHGWYLIKHMDSFIFTALVRDLLINNLNDVTVFMNELNPIPVLPASYLRAFFVLFCCPWVF